MLINESNKQKIEDMIKKAEGRATVRTIGYRDIVDGIATLENSLGIRKKDMIGIVADIDMNAQDFPMAYKYTPASTHFTVIRKASGWDLKEVFRDTTRRYNHRFHVNLTDTAKQAIIESKCAF